MSVDMIYFANKQAGGTQELLFLIDNRTVVNGSGTFKEN